MMTTVERQAKWTLYDPEPRRDTVRAVITYVLMATFVLVLAYALFAPHQSDEHYARTKDMLNIVIPAISGLVGSAVGFYFGASPKPS